MAKASFAVLRHYPTLAVFPVISGAVLLLVVGLIALSLLPQVALLNALAQPVWDRFGATDAGQIVFYIVAFVVIYLLTVVATFFNVALIFCALRALAGQEPSVGDGIAAATARLPQILGWAFIAATVGIVLNIVQGFLRDKLGFLGSLLGGLLEFGWATVTYFVLPVLVTEGLGPIAAVRRSSAILKAKWGEALAGEARFGLIGFLFGLLALAVFFLGLAVTLGYGGLGMAGLGPVLMTLGVVFFLAVIVVLQALNGIFQAGVYLYATTGQVPRTLDPELVQSAFRPKS
jgi:hypothetical protein